MVVPGFHYFVAWRYLMARPRRVSVPIFSVIGFLLTVSITVGALGRYVFPEPPRLGLAPIGTPGHMVDAAAIVFFGFAGLALIGGLCAHVARNPQRLFTPLSVPLALVAAAIAMIGLDAGYGITLAAAGALLLPSVIAYASRAPALERGLVGLLIVYFGGAGAATRLLAGRIDGMIVLDNRWVLGALGCILFGVLLTVALWLSYVRARPKRLPLLLCLAAPVAIGVGALLASQAHPTVDLFRPEIDMDVLVMLDRVRLVGLILAGVGGAFSIGSMARVVRRALKPRPTRVVGCLSVLALCAGLSAIALVQVAVSALSVPPTQLQLASVALLVLAELALFLGVVRYYFTFFTTVSMAGVCIGSMALVIVLSVMSGFETDLREKILGSNAHVLVTKEDGEFTEYEEIEELIRKVPKVVAVTPYFTSEVVVAANNNYANVLIKGIEPDTVGEVTDLEKNIKQERGLDALWPLAPDGSIIGAPPDEPGNWDPDEPYEPDPNAIDPAPGDMRVDDDDPEDFSAGIDTSTGPPVPISAEREDDEPEALGPGSGQALAPPGDTAPAVDQAPADLKVDDSDPEDYSGGEDPEVISERAAEESGIDRDDDFEGAIIDLPERSPAISPRVASLSGVLVGKELVKQIHLYVGQEVRMVSPLSDPTNPGGAPVPYTRNYRVAGTFYTGMYEYDLKFVYVELESLQEFLDLGDQVNGIEIRLEDPDDTSSVVSALNKQLGPTYRVQDWKEINRGLFSALKLEKIAMFLVLAIIILVASFSIIGNLIMVVVEKAKEIALLKTLGASNPGIMAVFITQGFFIGLVGTVVGVAHGLVACFLGEVFGLPLDPDVYYIDRLPIHVEWDAVALVAAAGVLISIVATIYPAYVGGRVRPIEGLRYE